jgi:hypothetical protein
LKNLKKVSAIKMRLNSYTSCLENNASLFYLDLIARMIICPEGNGSQLLLQEVTTFKYLPG